MAINNKDMNKTATEEEHLASFLLAHATNPEHARAFHEAAFTNLPVNDIKTHDIAIFDEKVGAGIFAYETEECWVAACLFLNPLADDHLEYVNKLFRLLVLLKAVENGHPEDAPLKIMNICGPVGEAAVADFENEDSATYKVSKEIDGEYTLCLADIGAELNSAGGKAMVLATIMALVTDDEEEGE